MDTAEIAYPKLLNLTRIGKMDSAKLTSVYGVCGEGVVLFLFSAFLLKRLNSIVNCLKNVFNTL